MSAKQKFILFLEVHEILYNFCILSGRSCLRHNQNLDGLRNLKQLKTCHKTMSQKTKVYSNQFEITVNIILLQRKEKKSFSHCSLKYCPFTSLQNPEVIIWPLKKRKTFANNNFLQTPFSRNLTAWPNNYLIRLCHHYSKIL